MNRSYVLCLIQPVLANAQTLPCYRYSPTLGLMSRMVSTSSVVPQVSSSSWEEYLQKQPKWQYEMLRDIRLDERIPLREYLTDATKDLLVVSDGSFRYGKGTYAWVLGTKESICLEARGTVFGQTMTSQRAEVCGILSWLLYLYHFTTCFQIKLKCKLKPFCDNLSAGMSVNFKGESKPRQKRASEYDLVSEARATLKRLTKRVRVDPIAHVKGHQSRSSLANVSRQAQLNIMADKLAKTAMLEWNEPRIKGIA